MTLPLGQRWLTGSESTLPDEPLESKGFDTIADVNSLTYLAARAAPRHSSVIVTSVIATGSFGRSFAFRGALAMANAGPNTNGSQFFICHQDLTGRLPKNYTLFGQVTKGLDVVDRIVAAPRDGRDLPNEPVAMTSVTIHED